MEVTTELLGTAGAGLAVLLAGLWHYWRNFRPGAKTDVVLPSIAGALADRDQMERQIRAQERIAEAVEGIHRAMTDKQAAGMNEKLDALMAVVSRPQRGPAKPSGS